MREREKKEEGWEGGRKEERKGFTILGGQKKFQKLFCNHIAMACQLEVKLNAFNLVTTHTNYYVMSIN